MTTFLEVGPMCDMQYTGIPETACRLAECALNEPLRDEFRFIVGASEVPRDIIAAAVEQRNGMVLASYLTEGMAAPLMIDPDDWNCCIYTQKVALYRAFDRQILLFYDLTPLICPEFHTVHAVQAFEAMFYYQIASVDYVVTISEAVRQDLVSYFPEFTAKISSSLCGLSRHDGTVISSRFREHPAGKPYFISLGTLEPRKNNLLILEALALFPHLLETHRFVFIGKRGWGGEMDDVVNGYGLGAALRNGDIVLTGFVSESKKQELIAGCTALIYPSHYEGFGLPPLEALAQGRPVICQPTSSIPEVVGDYAFYIETPDASGLLSAITAVLDLPASSSAAIAAERTAWAGRFDWRVMWNELKMRAALPTTSG